MARRFFSSATNTTTEHPATLRNRIRSSPVVRVTIVLTILMAGLLASRNFGLQTNWPEPAASAATLPSGFAETLVATGMTNPTAFAIAPDGRIFVCQQGGSLRVIQGGSLLATPFMTLSVNSSGERGLLGIAFDPDFATNNFLYVYYTTSASPIHNRISRFTANGNVVAAGSELVLLDLDNLSAATNHNGGALHFGPDGKLYAAVGENATSSNSQTLTNLLGKMLRMNADGSIPSDNPFFNTATGNNRAIWALGLRNPFTFNFQPGTGRMFINDVGQNTWEEINDGIAGSNYGWPNCESPCTPTNPSFRDPIYWYSNDASTCAITGGTFYNPATATFPAQYVGKYFFADFCAGWIKYIDPASPPSVGAAAIFATGLSSPVDLQVSSADGSLYYLHRGNGGQLWKIQYTANQPPMVTQDPGNQTVTEGQTATFTVAATGTAPLSYQWRKNNMDINGANLPTYTTPPVTLADSGAQYSCFVSNDFGNDTSNPATLTVLPASTTGLMFYPLPQPIRLLDTRTGQTGCDSPGAPIVGGVDRTQLARRTCGGVTIPAGALAITGNVTPVPTSQGFVTLYPSDAALPLAANSNFVANQIVNNVFTVGLGADGAFKIHVSTTTDVVIDVSGYYAPPGMGGLYFHPLPTPVRLLETRQGQPGCDTPGAPLSGASTRSEQGRVTCGSVTIPAAALALVGNATVVRPAAQGFLTLFPSNVARPLVSSGNYAGNDIINTPLTVGLGTDGAFNIFVTQTTDIVVDVLGYYSPDATDANGNGLLFYPLGAPVRLLDSRSGATACFTPGAPLTGGVEYAQQARGMCAGQTVAANALAVVGNVTTVNPVGGFLTLWPGNVTRPLVATSNFTAGQTANRHFTVGLGTDGTFRIYAAANTDLVIDLSGYFAP